MSGKITYPSVYCLPGVNNAAYCVRIKPAVACQGKVSLKVKLGPDALLADGGKTILSRTGKLSTNCTYSIKTRLRKAFFTARRQFAPHQKGAYVQVKFSATFLGNPVLNARMARTQHVVAQVVEP